MSIIKNPEYLPVFHHIPKSGGTYVLSWMQMLCRRYHIMRGDNQEKCWTATRIRRMLVNLKDGRQLTVVYYTPTDLTGSQDGILNFDNCIDSQGNLDKHRMVKAQINYIKNKFKPYENSPDTNYIQHDDFLNLVKNKEIAPFCISIDPIFWGGLKSPDESSSWKDARIFIDQVLSFVERKGVLNFTVLRNPYDRALSVFNYIKSEHSLHEPNHDLINAKSFEEFIKSDELEDSWFLRNLMDMANSKTIESHHLALAHEEYLNKFRISDISKVDDLINSVFREIYGILQSDVEEHVAQANIFRNSTQNKSKIKFEDLHPTTQQRFLDRTYWDRKLWERYCNIFHES